MGRDRLPGGLGSTQPIPQVMRLRPAHAPTAPHPRWWPARPIIFSLSYNIWPQKLQPRRPQPRRSDGRRRGHWACLETWLGVALPHWEKEHFLAGWGDAPNPGGVPAQGAGRPGQRWADTQGNQPSGTGRLGARCCDLIRLLSWADKLPIKACLEDAAEWGLAEHPAVGRGRTPLNPGSSSLV